MHQLNITNNLKVDRISIIAYFHGLKLRTIDAFVIKYRYFENQYLPVDSSVSIRLPAGPSNIRRLATSATSSRRNSRVGPPVSMPSSPPKNTTPSFLVASNFFFLKVFSPTSRTFSLVTCTVIYA